MDEALTSFESAMEADLNVPMAIGAIFILIRKVNQQLAAGDVAKEDASLVLEALARINNVVAVIDFNPAGTEHEDPDIELLVNKRDEARERKDYEEADRIREDLKKRNVVLEDTVYGTMYWVENK